MKKVWNQTLIWRILKVSILLLALLFIFNSCESNPASTEEQMTTRSSEFHIPDVGESFPLYKSAP